MPLLGTFGSVGRHFFFVPETEGEYAVSSLGGGGQRSSQTYYSAQDSPRTKDNLVQNVSSAKVEKPWDRGAVQPCVRSNLVLFC